MDYWNQLIQYLTEIKFHTVPKKKPKEPTPRYLVLYTDRILEYDPPYTIYHAVPTEAVYMAMVAIEIYGKVRVVDLDTSTIVLERARPCPCKKPHPWEFDYWKNQKVDE